MIYHDMDPKGLTRIRSIKNAHFFLQILNEQKQVKRTEMLKSSGETPRAKKSVLLMLQVLYKSCYVMYFVYYFVLRAYTLFSGRVFLVDLNIFRWVSRYHFPVPLLFMVLYYSR